MSWVFSSLTSLSQVGAHLIQSGQRLQLEILQTVPLSTSPLSAPDFKVTQALLPTNAVNHLAEGLWVGGSSSCTDYIVMGVPSMHLVETGNGKGRNQAEVRVLQLSAYQRADCPFVLSFAGYLYQREMYLDTVLGGANSWTVIFPKHTFREGGAKGSRQVKL